MARPQFSIGIEQWERGCGDVIPAGKGFGVGPECTQTGHLSTRPVLKSKRQFELQNVQPKQTEHRRCCRTSRSQINQIDSPEARKTVYRNVSPNKIKPPPTAVDGEIASPQNSHTQVGFNNGSINRIGEVSCGETDFRLRRPAEFARGYFDYASWNVSTIDTSRGKFATFTREYVRSNTPQFCLRVAFRSRNQIHRGAIR